jgi:hypothetical protein
MGEEMEPGMKSPFSHSDDELIMILEAYTGGIGRVLDIFTF